jgi:uncharacterized protein (TIGR00297 family)
MLERAAIGLLVAAIIATLARRARSLSRGGAVAATALGAMAAAAGYPWAMLLIAYFVSSSALSRLGSAESERLTASIVAKGGRRDARQVLANGGVFGVAALGAVLQPGVWWTALAAGSLAASAADTWATEIGTRFGGVPSSILSGKRVPVGTSGGVTVIGSVGAIAGALFVALVAVGVGWERLAASAAVAGGIVGASADSVFGATLQVRRWCDDCGRATERARHDCGAETRVNGGIAGFDNDMVNLFSVIAGGVAAIALFAAVHSRTAGVP